MVLYRPVNRAELDLIAASNFKAFPPRLPEQPIFYPVLNEGYAEQITVEWNVPTYGEGYVLKFEVADSFIAKYQVQTVGADDHTELWIPAEDLPALNANIIGHITVVSSFLKEASAN